MDGGEAVQLNTSMEQVTLNGLLTGIRYFSASIPLKDLLRDSILNQRKLFPGRWKTWFDKTNILLLVVLNQIQTDLAEIRAYLETNAEDKRPLF
jgi:hypothetical protein